MRILLMVQSLTGGGAERVAALWCTGFVERGYEVGITLDCSSKTSITYKIPSSVKMFNIYGITFIRRITDIICPQIRNFFLIRKIKRVIFDFHPDVIIGVMQPWAEWAKIATNGMAVKIINTEHNSFERPNCAPMSKETWIKKYVWNKHYNHVTVLNNVDKICAQDYLDNVTVLPNPLAFVPCKDLSDKKKIILAAGRFEDWHYKGFDILIKVWKEVAPIFRDWNLEIVGKGKKKDFNIVKKMIVDAGVEHRVTILGYQANMLPIYQRASVFMLTSRYEGFGMVLIEAMSQGCAPIACDYKGRQREIITNKEEGILCEPEDIYSLTKALIKMISDDMYRKKIQINAIKRSNFYKLDNIIDRWEEIFKKIGL